MQIGKSCRQSSFRFCSHDCDYPTHASVLFYESRRFSQGNRRPRWSLQVRIKGSRSFFWLFISLPESKSNYHQGRRLRWARLLAFREEAVVRSILVLAGGKERMQCCRGDFVSGAFHTFVERQSRESLDGIGLEETSTKYLKFKITGSS